MKNTATLLLALAITTSLNACSVEKAVDYSFYVTEHGDYEYDGRCFGIDDEPGERLLITDCGGYLNLISATLTLGLIHSSEETTNIYRNATNRYLESRYSACGVNRFLDHGGRLFEVFYDCERLER